jgi:hypothetical protein
MDRDRTRLKEINEKLKQIDQQTLNKMTDEDFKKYVLNLCAWIKNKKEKKKRLL